MSRNCVPTWRIADPNGVSGVGGRNKRWTVFFYEAGSGYGRGQKKPVQNWMGKKSQKTENRKLTRGGPEFDARGKEETNTRRRGKCRQAWWGVIKTGGGNSKAS